MRWKFLVNDTDYGEFSTLEELKELIERTWHDPTLCTLYNHLDRYIGQDLSLQELDALIDDWNGRLNFRFEEVS